MNELDFCKEICGGLSEVQEVVLNVKIKDGKFLGVAKNYYGRIFPLIEFGKDQKVLKTDGYCDLASSINSYSYDFYKDKLELLVSRLKA